MLHSLAPPVCLALALALLICGFVALSSDGPSASLDLHQARAEGDLVYQDKLETKLSNQHSNRTTMLIGLFGGSALAILLAFLLMDSK